MVLFAKDACLLRTAAQKTVKEIVQLDMGNFIAGRNGIGKNV